MAIQSALQFGNPSVLNTPLPLVRRTPREFACLAVGFWVMFSELNEPSSGNLFYLNLAMAVGGTVIFASRFFLSRIAGVAAGCAAGAQWWIAREHAWQNALHSNWRAYACIAVVLVLASGDLVQRFDRGRAHGWWPNTWRHLDRFDLAAVRWSLYLLFMCSALIHKGYANYAGASLEEQVSWVPMHTAGLVVLCAMLAFGRRTALLVLPLLSLYTLFHMIPDGTIPGTTLFAPPKIFAHMAHVGQSALVIAAVAAGLSLYVAVRFVRGRLQFEP